MAVSQVVSVASTCSALAAAACAWRAYDQRLVAFYPAFFFYFISQALLIGVSTLVDTHSYFYARVFIGVTVVNWLVYGLMVRELYTQIFKNYPGIAMFGKWSVYAAALLSIVIAILSRTATRKVLTKTSPVLIPTEVMGRTIVFGLALSIIVLLLILSRYPVELHRNVFVNCVLFSAILLAEAGSLLAVHLSNLLHVMALNAGLMTFDFLCFSAWAYLLTAQGAQATIKVAHRDNPEEERRLLDQLKALSSMGTRKTSAITFISNLIIAIVEFFRYPH